MTDLVISKEEFEYLGLFTNSTFLRKIIIRSGYKVSKNLNSKELANIYSKMTQQEKSFISGIIVDNLHNLGIYSFMSKQKINCICSKTYNIIPLFTSNCMQCEDIQHTHCIQKNILLNEYICPKCLLRNYSLNEEIINTILFPIPFIISQNQNQNFNYNFNFNPSFTIENLNPKSQYVLRCIKLNGKINGNQKWPKQFIVLINQDIIFQKLDNIRKKNKNKLRSLKINSENLKVNNELILVGSDKSSKYIAGLYEIKLKSNEKIIEDAKSKMPPINDSFNYYIENCFKKNNQSQMSQKIHDWQDVEILLDRIKVYLICPISGNPIEIPSRGKSCCHIDSFDLTSFLEANKEYRNYKCPLCKNVIRELYINTFLYRLIELIKSKEILAKKIYLFNDNSIKIKKACLMFDPQSENFNFESN